MRYGSGGALRLRRSLSTLKAPSFTMADVHYELPESLIGVRPAARGESKLLHYRGSEIEHRRFKDVVGLIPAGSVMIFNSSKVFNARLWAGEASDPTEIMMLSPESPSKDPAECYRQKVQGQVWNVVIRGGAVTSVDEGDVFECKTTSQAGASSMISIKVRKLYSIWEEHGELPGFEAAVEFMSEAKEQAETLAVCLDHVGTVPIPPYLNRSTIAQDSSDYQTVYADEEQSGSVAAPTAGLHFNEAILSSIRQNGTTLCDSLSLHVGAGTFKPVVSECISGHDMHVERFSASLSDLQVIANASRKASSSPDVRGPTLICVGTTSVRLVESLYWIGAKNLLSNMHQQASPSSEAGGPYENSADLDLELGQWEPEEIKQQWQESLHTQGRDLPSLAESYEYLLASGSGEDDAVIAGSTALCITPGYEFRATDKLITNFHQAESTLMLLVSAFLGQRGRGAGVDRLRHIYATALKSEYRFLSYGDSMFLDL